jgi:hypothetical protein
MGLSSYALWLKRKDYQEKALSYARRERHHLSTIETILEQLQIYPHHRTLFMEYIAEDRRAAVYLARMRIKYEHAASYPWIFVPLNHPEPEWLWQTERGK